MDAVAAEQLDSWPIPELALEFAEGLCRFWQQERERFTTEVVPSEKLFMMLDSLASTIIPDYYEGP